jgi:hypothetical protein
MNSNSFEEKHLQIYIEKPDDSINQILNSLSESDQYRAISAWGTYLIEREIEPSGVEILEKIWEENLSQLGIKRFDGINYLYFQLCSAIAYKESKIRLGLEK